MLSLGLSAISLYYLASLFLHANAELQNKRRALDEQAGVPQCMQYVEDFKVHLGLACTPTGGECENYFGMMTAGMKVRKIVI